MNDSYLFKAKTTVKENPNEAFNNIWVKGFLVVNNGKYYIHPIANKFLITGNLGQNVVMHEVDPSTLCQCTGLKDKNGNLIWENDVVMCNIEECSGHVAWNESECGFYFIAVFDDGTRDVEPLCDYANELEVIGSVFDNPELLEVE